MDNKKIANLLRQLADAFEEAPSILSHPVLDVHTSDSLKTLLESDKWPAAIDPEWICADTPEAAADRAKSIVNTIVDENLTGKRFLDVGCDQGYCCDAAIQAGAIFACGYDIEPFQRSSSLSLLTNHFDVVRDHGPYDIVMLYDVVDHIKQESVDELLAKIRSVLALEGLLFVRCHPWTSRHGGHYFRTLNKAYVHLVFTDQELQAMGHTATDYAHKIIHPLKQYNDWFKSFKIIYHDISNQSVEPFFTENAEIKARILANWRVSHDVNLREGRVFPDFQLSQQFVDYKLALK